MLNKVEYARAIVKADYPEARAQFYPGAVVIVNGNSLAVLGLKIEEVIATGRDTDQAWINAAFAVSRIDCN